jgi:hypothetical protein
LRDAGFYQRQMMGNGIWVTPDMVERESFLSSREFLRGVQGLSWLEDEYASSGSCPRTWARVTSEGATYCVRGPTSQRGPTILTRSAGTSGTPCVPAIYMDHHQVQPSGFLGEVFEFDFGTLPTSRILAIEVFRSAAEIPAEFSGGSSACGVILIWTKAAPGVPLQ